MQKLKKLQETRRNLRKNKKGFTLVELLVVLAILAILIAVAVPTLTGVLNDAKDKTYLQEARAAYIAYLLKATDASSPDEVKLADIQGYLAVSTDIGVAVTLNAPATAGASVPATDVKNFKYQPKGLKDQGKYVDIELGIGGTTQGKIEKAAFPTASKDSLYVLS